jgi:hypothetical protein
LVSFRNKIMLKEIFKKRKSKQEVTFILHCNLQEYILS